MNERYLLKKSPLPVLPRWASVAERARGDKRLDPRASSEAPVNRWLVSDDTTNRTVEALKSPGVGDEMK